MENLRGIALMTLAMAGFALEDALIKSAAGALPLGPIVVLFGLGGFLAFWGLLRARGEPLIVAETRAPAVLWRAVFEVLGRAGYFLGITLTPLSNASAILQATPLVVTAGAALAFAEPVGWRRWAAIGVGFAGVLIVLRPGLEGFQAASLFTVVGMLGFALRDLGTRAAPAGLSNLQLAAYGFAVLIPTGLILTPFSGPITLPGPQGWALIGLATLFGATGYYAITAAMRVGDVAVVAPFRYTRLVFALILAFLMFDERPDTAMLLGAALIVGSGLYTLLRESRT